jgi:type III secretion protein L
MSASTINHQPSTINHQPSTIARNRPMLAKRSLCVNSATIVAEPILRHADIVDSLRAREVLEDARRQGEQLLTELQAQAQSRHEQALAEFWDTANGFLHSLGQQRESLQREAMASVEALLTSALSRLLDETTLAERVRALARNLAASQLNESVATLSCHPDMLGALTRWLTDSRFAEHWQLRSDASLPADSLRLSDANGAFDIDWKHLRRGLLGAEAVE